MLYHRQSKLSMVGSLIFNRCGIILCNPQSGNIKKISVMVKADNSSSWTINGSYFTMRYISEREKTLLLLLNGKVLMGR